MKVQREDIKQSQSSYTGAVDQKALSRCSLRVARVSILFICNSSHYYFLICTYFFLKLLCLILLAENLGPPHTQWTHTWQGQARHRRETPLHQRGVPCRQQGPAPGLPRNWRGSIHRQGQDPLAAWGRGADPSLSSLGRPAQSGKWHMDYLLTARVTRFLPWLTFCSSNSLYLHSVRRQLQGWLTDTEGRMTELPVSSFSSQHCMIKITRRRNLQREEKMMKKMHTRACGHACV